MKPWAIAIMKLKPKKRDISFENVSFDGDKFGGVRLLFPANLITQFSRAFIHFWSACAKCFIAEWN